MKIVRSRLLIAAVAAGGVALAVLMVGPVQAQLAGDEPGKKAQRYDELLASELGISVDRLHQARDDARTKLIDEAVAAGRLTPEQAEKLKQGDGMARRPPILHRLVGGLLKEAAGILGLSNDELRQDLQQNKSLADVAREQGVTDFEDRLRSAIESRLQQAVNDGKIDQQTADRIRQGLDQHLDDIINKQGPLRTLRPGGGMMLPRQK